MTLDQHQNPMTATADATALYDRAVDDLLAYRPAVLEHMATFAAEHPTTPMPLVFTAYLHLTSTDPRDLDTAHGIAATLADVECNEREAMHRSAIDAWRTGDWRAASRQIDDVLERWPADMLALLVGHQLDFFLGDAINLRDRVGRSLGALDAGDPHHAFMLGMHAFGLEESGHYEAAEAAGRAALDGHADDVWATHAVAHVHEMQGRVDDGIGFLTSTESNWGSGNLFTVHLWWHLALFLLEQHRTDEVLAVYDREVHHRDAAAVPIEMLDASALLWRLHLDGIDTGDRFGALADAWAGGSVERAWYVFNDVHALMAMTGAGRLPEARAHLARLEHDAVADDASAGTRDTYPAAGLPCARAIVAFAEGRHDDVVNDLLPVRRTLHRFGGSHAQRDVVQRTLLESAVRGGRRDLAAALLRERLSTRPSGDFALSRLARADVQAVRASAGRDAMV